jgi:hypothetical protein
MRIQGSISWKIPPPPPHCLGKKYGLRCKRYQKTKQALTKIRRKRKKRQGKKRKVTK